MPVKIRQCDPTRIVHRKRRAPRSGQCFQNGHITANTCVLGRVYETGIKRIGCQSSGHRMRCVDHVKLGSRLPIFGSTCIKRNHGLFRARAAKKYGPDIACIHSRHQIGNTGRVRRAKIEGNQITGRIVKTVVPKACVQLGDRMSKPNDTVINTIAYQADVWV